MESSKYVDRTLELFEGVARSAIENVGICIQSCLFRSANDLERLMAAKAAVRIVKGAYSEPADGGLASEERR